MTGPPRSSYPPEDADNSLDKRLTHSAPAGTRATVELKKELSRISACCREEASGRRRAGRFGPSRGAAVGLAACVLMGSDAAAAAVVDLRSYSSDMDVEPHGHYSFELPGGAECVVETRVVKLGPPGYENVARFSTPWDPRW